jgi:anti-anti-sigma regulatory factor
MTQVRDIPTAPPGQVDQFGLIMVLAAMLEGDCVRDLYEELVGRLDAGAATQIDAHDIIQISTQAVQVLVAAATSFEAAGLPFLYCDPSDAFIDALSDLGLYSHLSTRVAMNTDADTDMVMVMDMAMDMDD